MSVGRSVRSGSLGVWLRKGSMMVRDQQKFPRLNLARVEAVQLIVFGTYESTEERRALLPERRHRAPGTQPERGIVGFAQYTTRGKHRASYQIAATSHTDDDNDEIHVTISYRELDGGGSRRTVRGSEEAFLEIVQAMGTPREAHGLALFEFDRRAPNQLWFPLPVTLAGRSPEDTIEVRGVRGAKLGSEGGDPDYEFILDRPTGQEVLLRVELKIEEPITPEVVQTMSHRASVIARELVQAPSSEEIRGTPR